MSNDDEQKRHISRVISAIRDDDAPGNKSSREAAPDPDLEEGIDGVDEFAEDEYYVDEEERRQWDYDEASPGAAVKDPEERRSQKDTDRSVGWGRLLDWRLMVALGILVAGLFMVNFSGDDDDVPDGAMSSTVTGDARTEGVATERMTESDALAQGGVEATSLEVGEIARLEARITALEQRLSTRVNATEGGVGDGETASANAVTKDELQILRDQVNAGLKAQQDATKAAVRDLERRLTRSIDTKVATARSSAQTPSAGGSQPQAAAVAGSWFVNVATYSQRATADAMVKRLQDSGHSAAIAPATIGGEPSFRVRVINLTSRETAQETARGLESKLGVRGLWVGES